MIRLFKALLDVFTIKGILNILMFTFMFIILTILGTLVGGGLLAQYSDGEAVEFIKQLMFWREGSYVEYFVVPFTNFIEQLGAPARSVGATQWLGDLPINIWLFIKNSIMSFGHILLPLKSFKGDSMGGSSVTEYVELVREIGAIELLSYLVLYVSAIFSFIFVRNNPLDVVNYRGNFQVDPRDAMPGVTRKKIKWNRKRNRK